jgi:CubicO group peptidase (beta-lactamase class C family)
MLSRKVLTIIAAAALPLAAVPALAQDANPAQTFARLSDAELVKRVNAAIEQVVARPEAAGLSIAVARGDRIILERGAGAANLERNEAADANTIFRIGSLTKQFTAAAIMKLADQGKLSLDDPLAKYVPEFDTGGRTVTIRQLLNHSSGVPNYTAQPRFMTELIAKPDLKKQDVLDVVAGVPFDFEPGTGWRYSNTGYYLLGLVVEKASGRSYADFLQHELFEPLRLTHTLYDAGTAAVPGRALGYSVDPLSGTRHLASAVNMVGPFSAGALASTAGDLLRWQIALTGGRAIAPASFEQMVGSTVKTGRGDAVDGYGLIVDRMIGQRHIWHNGGIYGFNSVLSWFPDMGLRTAVLSNSEALPSEAVEAMIIQALTSEAGLTPLRSAPQPGSEAALRAMIAGLASGSPDYAAMTPQLAEVTRAQLPGLRGLLQAFGPLQSLKFRDVNLNGVDEYIGQFEKGAALFSISLDPEGKIGGAFFRPLGPPPQPPAAAP